MNSSSGIKRGLAASAISALAIAGLPLLASSANAAAGDEIQFVSAGPTLNHGAVGGEIHVKLKGITEAELDSDLTVFNSALTDNSADSATQSVTITDESFEYVASGATGDSNPTDGYAEATVLVAVDTPVDGNTANYALVVDDNNDGAVTVNEARTQVSQATSGALSKIEVAPATQSSPQNLESGDYTVTLKDAAGRTTQLDTAQVVNLTPSAGSVTPSDTQFDEFELVDGTEAFTATGTAVGTFTIAIDSPSYTGEQTSAEFKVTPAATLTAANIDIVTAADTWNGLGNTSDSDGDATKTFVRVDQNTIRFDFDAADSQAGANVQLSVDGTDVGPGNGVTFAGKNTATYTTTLDAHGNGSITVTADAATVQDGDTFAVDINGFDQTLVFERSYVDSVDSESGTYFCQLKSACTVTAVVTDQFGNPVTTGQVKATLSGTNDTTSQRKAVGSDGTVDFTFTDSKATNGATDTVSFEYFDDAFDNDSSDDPTGSTTIKWTTTGQGNDYVISMDGASTEAAGYKASDHDVIPLFDTVVDTYTDPITSVVTQDPEDEAADISIAGGENNQAVTLSVDNGALILAPGEDQLSEGSSSVDTAFTGTTLTGYRIIGTKSGLVTLTVSSAGRTETTQILVKGETDTESARNVTLTAPATVPQGTNQITFVAVVTDAFGNPVPGVSNSAFNKQVSGPAMYQDGDSQTDANGQLKLNVRVDSGATGDVTLSVDATDGWGQFGAQADRQYSAPWSTTDDGKGLPVSSDKASATTTVVAATPAPTRSPITAILSGANNGAMADKLKVDAPSSAHGATVKLFKVRMDGSRKLLSTSTLNSLGNKGFTVADHNGNRVTKYIAKVARTATTMADWTNSKRVR